MQQIKWQLEFPPEIQAEREPIVAALDRAMNEATVEAVREAQTLAGEWLARHPEDLIIWDAGEPIAMLADALVAMGRRKSGRSLKPGNAKSRLSPADPVNTKAAAPYFWKPLPFDYEP